MNETEITLYISEDGDDSNEGTNEKPLWSVAAALDRIRGKLYGAAYLIITGSVTEVAARNAMIDITGGDLPVIYLQGGGSENPGTLDAQGLDKRVIYIADGNKVYLGKNIVIRGGVTQDSGGAGITVDRGTLIMRGAEISDNDAGFGMGGGVYLSGESEFIMESGLIARNKTKMNGGGVFPDDGGKFTMLGGTISDNEAIVSGAGVFVGIGAQFVLRDGLIGDNIAGGEKLIRIGGVSIPYGKGGSVFVCSNAHFIMEDGKIEYNRAIAVEREDYAGSGGGVFVDAGGVFTFEKGLITKNGVMNWGGGVYSQGSFTCQSNAMITNNVARLGGGGVFVAGKEGVFIVKGGLLMKNYTAGMGGAVHVMEDGSFTMEGGLVVKNSAGKLGNAFAISGLGTINGGAIVENFDALKDDNTKDSETGTSREAVPCIIVIEDTGKLVIQKGEIDGKILMKKADLLEDRREKEEAD
ncbi:hypothetical protein LQZ21_00070 [Treponema sp. TIM-1]|uniref:hypothetical protein n=1 Tax=Treponema sp. TIM-1 TaxID=2898417 RepID=UPI00397F9659